MERKSWSSKSGSAAFTAARSTPSISAAGPVLEEFLFLVEHLLVLRLLGLRVDQDLRDLLVIVREDRVEQAAEHVLPVRIRTPSTDRVELAVNGGRLGLRGLWVGHGRILLHAQIGPPGSYPRTCRAGPRPMGWRLLRATTQHKQLRRRRQSRLGRLTPIEYEMITTLQTATAP